MAKDVLGKLDRETDSLGQGCGPHVFWGEHGVDRPSTGHGFLPARRVANGAWLHLEVRVDAEIASKPTKLT